MTNLIDYHIPEAIQIKVTKEIESTDCCVLDLKQQQSPAHDNNNNNNVCNFCVDPQLTTFAVLQALVVRAFNLKSDFTLHYLDRSSKKYKIIYHDKDLKQAFLTASHPFLELILCLIDYTTALEACADEVIPATDWQLAKNFTKYRNMLSDWDVVTSSDVILAQTFTKTNNFIVQQIGKIKEKAKSLGNNPGNNSWYLAETIYQYIASVDDRRLDPIDDALFRSFQDKEGRIKSQRDLRIAIYRRGVDASLRRVIWKHLLNVYPENYSGQERIDFIKLRCETYRQMRKLWQMNMKIDPDVIQLSNMVRKDVRRTDRQHEFYSTCKRSPTNSDFVSDGASGGIGAEEDFNANVNSLFNILMTYALNHKYRYCQGMSDIASPLLYVMKDEAHAYITFCALMHRLGENFSLDGQAISRKFQNLTALLKHYDPDFYRYLYANGAHELLFGYRWLLLDLKREFSFTDALEMLEVLWASIPPNTLAYQNLFDDGYLYIPNQTKKEPVLNNTSLVDEKNKKMNVETELNKRVNTVETSAKVNKPQNHHIRSIKFLPNVLSSDSAVLDSPITSDSDECDFAKRLNYSTVITTTATTTTTSGNQQSQAECHINHNTGYVSGPKPWGSPDLGKNRKQFDYGLMSSYSGAGDTNGSVCEDIGSSYDDDNYDEHTLECYKKFGRHDSQFSNRSQTDDLSSTCSTFDSGIQRSNTMSDESVHSVHVNRGDSNDSTFNIIDANIKPRQRSHCLSGLGNAHCNGDEYSDEDESSDYYQKSFDPMQSYSDCKSSQLTESFQSIKTIADANHSTPQCVKLSRPIMNYSLNSSVDNIMSIDSNVDNDNKQQQENMSNAAENFVTKGEGPQITVDQDLLIDKFESNYRTGVSMAKSVSEEVLNNLADNCMSTLQVSNPEDGNSLDNISSSSTSSLVILSKRSPSTSKEEDENMIVTQRLLSPDELGSNDAFMLFLCLTIMLQNRNHIMESGMDRNDIQMFFDNMIRKHNVRSVLNDARHLFHTYLSQWHKECLQ